MHSYHILYYFDVGMLIGLMWLPLRSLASSTCLPARPELVCKGGWMPGWIAQQSDPRPGVVTLRCICIACRGVRIFRCRRFIALSAWRTSSLSSLPLILQKSCGKERELDWVNSDWIFRKCKSGCAILYHAAPSVRLFLGYLLQNWAWEMGQRLHEFFRQVEAEVVSNSRNKIHQNRALLLAHSCWLKVIVKSASHIDFWCYEYKPFRASRGS